jgi:SPP1 family predicted phage head-tail adaptor
MAGKQRSISIGRLRQKVTLEKATSTTDNAGGCTETWASVVSFYADIRPSGGDEAYRQGKVQDKITHKVYCRWRSDIKTAYRLKYESRYFNIKSIKNIDERDRFLELTCSEGETS